MPIEILMPALSPTMTEGTLARWLKKEGDGVKAGEVIAEIETDKATMEVEAVDEGMVGKLLVAEGAEHVPVNVVIAVLLAEGEDKGVLDSYTPSARMPSVKGEGTKKEESTHTSPIKQEVVADAKKDTMPSVPVQPVEKPVPMAKALAPITTDRADGRIKISPLAKRLAAEKGIDLKYVRGTGPHGRIVKMDIEHAGMGGGGRPQIVRDPVESQVMPLNGMRKAIAKRLLESKQTIPHFYLTVDCRIDKLLELRSELNSVAQEEAGKGNTPSYKLSVNDMVIKAVALALKKVPEANASWGEKEIIRYRNIDVAVAVAIDNGLVTPLIRNADQKDLPSISNEMKSLAQRAREGKLLPEEYQGGGFSISNLGMYGIKHFSAIINPPQSCILAVGAGEARAVVVGNEIGVATVMTVTLSCDHRVVDGAVGAAFLEAFKRIIESPSRMLLPVPLG